MLIDGEQCRYISKKYIGVENNIRKEWKYGNRVSA